MVFFVHIDTYMHQPRNIFGMKKRNVNYEFRPVTVTVFSSSGLYVTASFKGVKLADDALWSGIAVNPADYGYPLRSDAVLSKIIDFMQEQCQYGGTEKVTIIWTEAFIHTEFQRQFVNKLEEEFPSFECKYLEVVEAVVAAALPTQYFKDHLSDFGKYINTEDGEELSADQKRTWLRSHKRYPNMLSPNTMSLGRAHGAYTKWNVLTKIDAAESLGAMPQI